MGKYVVWGCGKFYKRYKKFLEIPGLDIAYIVDSDSSKWDDPSLFEILSILHYHQNLFPYAMHRWKNKLLMIENQNIKT